MTLKKITRDTIALKAPDPNCKECNGLGIVDVQVVTRKNYDQHLTRLLDEWEEVPCYECTQED